MTVFAGMDVRIDGSWFWDQARPTFRTVKGATIVDDAGVVYARCWYEGEGAVKEIPVTSRKGVAYLTVPDLAAESAGWLEFR